MPRSFFGRSLRRALTKRPSRRHRSSRLGGAPERLEDRRLLANTVGLITHDPAAAYEGYTLFAPMNATTTYLVDMEGNEVRSWTSNLFPTTAELLPDGSLIRAGRVPTQGLAPGEAPKRWAGGLSGRIEKFDWEGNRTWSYTLATPDMHLHHDFEVLPNGNVLMIVWEKHDYAESVQAGRRADDVPRAPLPSDTDTWTGPREIWSDTIIEVRPNEPAPGATEAEGGEIVWTWRLWDHLVQNVDPTKDNFGSIYRNPHKVDINYYLKGDGMAAVPADWTHFNAIDYNPELKQIMLSVREFSEFWIIDHSTTTEEAAGSTGGWGGRGGDLLYRWGNPASYKRGGPLAQQLFYQHDAQWIAPGLPGAGNALVFDNGWNPNPRRPSFSRAVEVTLPENPAQWHLSESLGAARGPQALTRAAAVRTTASLDAVPDAWLPVSGDWDGDGIDSVGLFDPDLLTFHLYTAPGEADAATVIDAAAAGAGDWLPIAGDFDGDGTDTVGLFDRGTGRFLVTNDTTSWSAVTEIVATVPVARLATGWQPIAGDFDGDGTDTVGIYLPAIGQFRFTNGIDAWPTTVAEGLRFQRLMAPVGQLRIGAPVVGDFRGTGTDTVGVYLSGQRMWVLAQGVPGVRQPVTRLRTAWAQAGWKPVVGDWSGTGADTTGVYNPTHTRTGYGTPTVGPWGPARPTWQYFSTPRSDFYARIISGAHRLPNGNTIINEGTEGRIFEVTPERRIVWEYINPVVGREADGSPTILRQGERPALRVVGPNNIRNVYANLQFRAYRYGTDFAGFAGRDLTPRGPIELPSEAVAAAVAGLGAG